MKRETNSYSLKIKEINKLDDELYCGSFTAYFSTYGTVNLRPDRMIKGCFDSEIARFKNGDKLPRLLNQHWGDDVIGKVTGIYDDDIGAIVEAKFLNTVQGNDAYIGLKTGAKDELSFSFYVKAFDYDEAGVRNVLRVEDIEEVSIVTWGMDPKTRPIEVNSKNLTIRDAEQALKDKGFTNKQSKIILSNGFKNAIRDELHDGRDADLADIKDKLKDFNAILNKEIENGRN